MALTITLHQDWKEFIDSEVAAAGFQSPDKYVQFLLTQASLRKAHDRVEALLEEGLNSGPATEWTAQNLESIRRVVHERNQ